MIVAVGVEYLGTPYCGWQRQTHSPSVQSHVENALSQVAAHPVQVYCAGRTDTGVHAIGQVIHFETQAQRPSKAWVLGGNAHLPDDIAIQWAQVMPEDFHARFTAISRRYRYVIANTSSRPGVLNGQVTWVRDPLDEQLMNQAAQALRGEQDFTSFQAASCQSPTPFRNVFQVKVERRKEFVIVDICANAFLHHMVRNIVGSLIEVGRGNQKAEWIDWLLKQKDRTIAAPTAASDGLYFVQVNYPKGYLLPERHSHLWLFD